MNLLYLVLNESKDIYGNNPDYSHEQSGLCKFYGNVFMLPSKKVGENQRCHNGCIRLDNKFWGVDV